MPNDTPKHPIELKHFIRLETESELPKSKAMEWRRIVNEYAPSGTVTGYAVSSLDGEPDMTYILHSEMKDKKHYYDVPLVRDLVEKEFDAVALAWDTRNQDQHWTYACSGDFPIPMVDTYRAKQLQVVKPDWADFCEEWSKVEHNNWVNEMVAKGWRLGPKLSRQEKTHPKLRPWPDLPESWRKVDEKLPGRFLDILERQGFSIIPTKRLEKLLKKS